MKQKAIIFDIDGTAIDSPVQKLPDPELVAEIVRLQKDYYICSATGRVWSFAKPALSALKLTDPCIISAGTQICDPRTGKILWQRTIDPQALEQAAAVLINFPDFKLLFNDATEADYFYGGIDPADFAPKEPVYFLEQVFVPDQIAFEVQTALSGIKGITCVMVVAQKPGCRDLHIIDSAATKEHAIGQLLRLIGVDKQETIGIGDGHNDIHLFNAVGYRVAMGNAVAELKQVADEVTGSIAEHGMTVYLRKLKG